MLSDTIRTVKDAEEKAAARVAEARQAAKADIAAATAAAADAETAAIEAAHAAKAAVSCFAFILASRTCATLQQQASSRKKGKRTQKPDVRTNPQTRRGQKPSTRVSLQVGRTKKRGGRDRCARPVYLLRSRSGTCGAAGRGPG